MTYYWVVAVPVLGFVAYKVYNMFNSEPRQRQVVEPLKMDRDVELAVITPQPPSVLHLQTAPLEVPYPEEEDPVLEDIPELEEEEPELEDEVPDVPLPVTTDVVLEASSENLSE